MKPFITLCVAAALAASTVAVAKNSFVSQDYGVSMSPPTFTGAEAASVLIAGFYLPVSDGFAPNVNLMRQAYAGTMASYVKLTKDQFKAQNFKMVSEKVSGDQAVWDCKGSMGGRATHLYVKAVKKGKYVFLATATALEGQWSKQKVALMASVNSMMAK